MLKEKAAPAVSGTAYLNLLNVLSAVAVVILHTNGCFWEFSTERYWVTANIINSVFIFAVPIFFMISGATLLDYRARYDTKEFFRKRLSKTAIPFLAWSGICLLIKLADGRIAAGDISLRFLFNGLANNTFNSVYWFFWPLFGIYACIPLLAAVPCERRRSLYSYLAVACFTVNNLIPFLNDVFRLGLQWPLHIQVGSGYLLYVLIGYLLRHFEMKQWMRLCVYGLSLAGLCLYIFGTWVLSFRAGEIIRTFKGAANVPAIAYATGVFLLFRQVGNRLMACHLPAAVVGFLKDYTFCIYLMHMTVLELLIRWMGINTHAILWRLGGFVLILPVCIGVTWLLRRLPVIRHIVP